MDTAPSSTGDPVVDEPLIYTYTDYRRFLRDWYERRKHSEEGYTFRLMAEEIGFKSAGHLNLVLNGKVGLTTRYMRKVIAALDLNKKEAHYFRSLVGYTQATDAEEKQQHFKGMLVSREFRANVVDARQYGLFKKWYYIAIREIVAIYPVKDDYKSLAKLTVPSITPAQAQRAVRVLEKLGFIKRNDAGIFERTSPLLTTGYEIPTVAVSTFLAQTMQLATEALFKIPRPERNVSWATVSVSQKSFDQIQDELRSFRQRILEIAGKDESPERVYHFGFQVIPLSRPRTEPKDPV